MKDAQQYGAYNDEMEKLADAINFLIDASPVQRNSRFGEKYQTLSQLQKMGMYYC